MGLGLLYSRVKKTVYPTAGRPGRSTGGNREQTRFQSVDRVGRPRRSTGNGQKTNFCSRLDRSTAPVDRALCQARSVDRAGRPAQLKTVK